MGIVDAKSVEAALEWHRENPKKNTIRQAAVRYGLKRSTLHDRLHGRKSRAEVSQLKQKLYPAEEKLLVVAILAYFDLGFPVRVRQLKSWALCVLQLRNPHTRILGKNWVSRFLKRHPEIGTRWRQTMDRVRVRAANPESINAFSQKVRILVLLVVSSTDPKSQLREICIEYGINMDRIFNMDEKGVAMGLLIKAKVIVRRGERGFQLQGKTAPLSFRVSRTHYLCLLNRRKSREHHHNRMRLCKRVCPLTTLHL